MADTLACSLVIDEGRVDELRDALEEFKKAARLESVRVELIRGVEVRLL